MAAPSIWLKKLLLQTKWVCDVAKKKGVSSFLEIFRSRLWFKMRFIYISMVSLSKISVKRLVISQETRKTKENVSLIEKPWETKGERI